MIDQPLPDRKRDYWVTIFNRVVPDDNSGTYVMKSCIQSLVMMKFV